MIKHLKPSLCHAGRSWGNTSWAERTCLHCVINDHESSMINVGSYFSGFWVVYKQCPSGIKRLSRVVICRSMHFINIMLCCCLARSCKGTNSRANRTHHACVMCITGPAICGLCMFVIAHNEIVFFIHKQFYEIEFCPPFEHKRIKRVWGDGDTTVPQAGSTEQGHLCRDIWSV